MCFDDTVRDIKAQAEPRRAARRPRCPVEAIENAGEHLRWDTRPLVNERHSCFVLCAVNTHDDLATARCRVFDRVCQQVREHLSEPLPVRHHLHGHTGRLDADPGLSHAKRIRRGKGLSDQIDLRWYEFEVVCLDL